MAGLFPVLSGSYSFLSKEKVLTTLFFKKIIIWKYIYRKVV